MRKYVLAVAVVALAAPSFAFAGDTQQDKKVVPSVTTAKQMNDAEMDKVTAGSNKADSPCGGGVGGTCAGTGNPSTPGQGALNNNKGNGRF
jgi:hypothetical protein